MPGIIQESHLIVTPNPLTLCPRPNVRPKRVNPKTDVSSTWLQGCVIDAFSKLLSPKFYRWWYSLQFFEGTPSLLWDVYLPLLLFHWLYWHSSTLQWISAWDANLFVSKMVAAYKFATKDLPFDCKQDGDPFEKTPAYIRYSRNNQRSLLLVLRYCIRDQSLLGPSSAYITTWIGLPEWTAAIPK